MRDPLTRVHGPFTRVRKSLLCVNDSFIRVNEPFTRVNDLFTRVRESFIVVNAAYIDVNDRFIVVNEPFIVVNEPFIVVNESFIVVNAPRARPRNPHDAVFRAVGTVSRYGTVTRSRFCITRRVDRGGTARVILDAHRVPRSGAPEPCRVRTDFVRTVPIAG